MSDLAQWLREPPLLVVWSAARERLERNGVQPRGTVTVGGLDRVARHAVGGLLGRPVLRESARLDLAELDARLRERSGIGGLVAVLEALGGPLRNRVAERSSQAAAREAPYDAARAWLAARPDVAAEAWVADWLVDVRRSGVLGRRSDGAVVLRQALEVASRCLEGRDAAPLSRTELAARATGDAHALDEGSVVGALVLRALAGAARTPVPTTLTARRGLWEQYGVSADLVSSTALVLGLRPLGSSSVARRLAAAAESGDPVHLTAWDLARGPLTPTAHTWVLVCENPRVLEAFAQRCGGVVPVVCTSGMPGLVALEVLAQLAASGVELAYHGDFDWPGVAIANRLVGTLGALPWRMGAADYLGAARGDGLALEGRPVVPAWDPALGAAMVERGVAVHEEAVLDELVQSVLDRWPDSADE